MTSLALQSRRTPHVTQCRLKERNKPSEKGKFNRVANRWKESAKIIHYKAQSRDGNKQLLTLLTKRNCPIRNSKIKKISKHVTKVKFQYLFFFFLFFLKISLYTVLSWNSRWKIDKKLKNENIVHLKKRYVKKNPDFYTVVQVNDS